MMDCADCRYAERAPSGGLVCGFTGVAVPIRDPRPGMHCPLDLPISDPAARDAIAAILLAAERRGRLGELLLQYPQADRWRLWDIAVEWLNDALGERHNPMTDTKPPQPHADLSAVDSSAEATKEQTG